MTDQAAKAARFHALHVKGKPLMLYNIWDPGSAKAVEAAGAQALATGSLPVAMAAGFADGEDVPLDYALANIARIVAGTDLPVTLDFESGYALDPGQITENIEKAVATGIVGVNFEDQVIGGSGLHAIDAQTARLKAVRAGSTDLFINARTDIFLKAAPDTHSSEMLAEAITRAQAFADAGASGFFAPGLRDEAMIAELCDTVSLPVNMITLPGTPPPAKLAELGVARISYGPMVYRAMSKWLEDAARAAFDTVG